MSTTLVTAEQIQRQEFAAKQAELLTLQSEVAERELQLLTLRAELGAFEVKYVRTVGILYAELDEWNAKIAELIAEETQTEEAASTATQAREAARQSRAAADMQSESAMDFNPSPELKKLRREIAMKIHPDFARDEADRAKRERLMKEANAAYLRGDLNALKKLLDQYENSPEAVFSGRTTAEIERAIRHIAELRKRLSEIEAEITKLTCSDTAKLMAKVETARAQGRDLLAQIASDLRRQINDADRRYTNIKSATHN